MSTFIFVMLAAGITYLALFHKPQNHTDAEIKAWFSSKLEEITARLDADIDQDKLGEYPHAGKQSFTKRGAITYVLLDKHNARFDISDRNLLSRNDISATQGYKKLHDKTQALHLTVRLDEVMVDGDDVDSFNSLDEYIDDFPRYYTVTISGW